MKALQVATDIYDDFLANGRFYDVVHLQALMAYCRGLGATTVEWILDDMWGIYEDYPGGFDLLAAAIAAAHTAGLRCHVVYKPFEGALGHLVLPQDVPRPPGAVLWEDLRGGLPIVRPFAAAHPECCLRRRPGDEDPGGPVRALRLVKNDDLPARLTTADLSLWTGAVNGVWRRYAGPLTLSESVEWRPLFPLGRTCRVVTLAGLELPPEARYFELRLADGVLTDAPWRNDYDRLVELVGAAGRVIPSTPAVGDVGAAGGLAALATPILARMVRYARLPEVAAALARPPPPTELRAYDRPAGDRELALELKRRHAVARGKPPYLPGILNPVYPEVRAEWLRVVRECIARGADAVNFRPTYHLRTQEGWAYGYNPPVWQAIGGREDVAAAARVMGDAYTAFLRAARDLLHAHGRQCGVHLISTHLRPPDEGRRAPVHEIMEFQWETWLHELADFAVFRGAMGYREESLRYVIDRFGGACRRAGVPLIYQSNRRIFDHPRAPLELAPDRRQWLDYEMAYALGHPDVSGYQFYETAYFTRLDEQGRFRGSDEVRAAARRHGGGAAP